MVLHCLSYSNLTGNNFTRPLPAELLAKSKKGSLLLRFALLTLELSSKQNKF